ncbi:helix-turn-helix domain-containing protein [Tumebacillus flagellatus]|uniref:HTH cro/C1-type domain-containing protein n=1 Tax=Tumebacillus flagellatus TaxID=1157490 RepID=A0A074LRG0_9BACL|nr:helix-turn-helix transcriptional regulator [Tumebacillus flagellatus]KEO82423.1 hypothetical protein EL26_15190 [Tumebacillus flagellatus]
MLGAKLKQLRESRKLKQHDMAKLLDVKREAYSHYETGRRKLPPQSILQLATVFDISIDYLFGLTENPTPPARDFQQIDRALLLRLQEKLALDATPDKLADEEQTALRQLVDIALKHRGESS